MPENIRIVVDDREVRSGILEVLRGLDGVSAEVHGIGPTTAKRICWAIREEESPYSAADR